MSERTIDRIVGPLDAEVSVPGSKSIANRMLVCAAMAPGRSELSNLPDGDDVAAMLTCLAQIGVGVESAADGATAITGVGRPVPAPGTVLNAGLAGTTSRFLVALSALSDVPLTVDGADPLRQRPFGPLLDALDQLGASLHFDGATGHLPVTVAGPLVSAPVTIAGDVSSQFISALMMIAPLIEDGLALTITGDLVSTPYVELTRDVMARFGVDSVTVDPTLITVGSATYRATDSEVEPDASSASYPLALAAMIGGSVTVTGLGTSSRQGDARFANVLAEMGCDVTVTEASTTVRRSPSVPLSGIDIDMADISDLVPTLAAVAAVADSPTRIRGVGFIRGKESDRLGDLAREFSTLGVSIVEESDGLSIEPSADALRPGSIATHHDHRLAMAGGLLGARIGGVVIEDPDVVTKSWPGFWSMLTAIGR